MCPGRGGGRTWTSYHGPPRGGRRPPGDLPGGEEVVPGEDLRRQKLWFHHYDRTVALLCHRRRQLSQRGVATFYHESPQAAAARQFHRRCTTSRRCSTASGPGASDASRPRAPRGARPPEVSPAAGHRSGAERLEARAPEWPPAPRSQGEVERVPLQGYFSLSAQNPPVGGQARQNPRAQGAAGRGVEGTARAPRPARGGSSRCPCRYRDLCVPRSCSLLRRFQVLCDPCAEASCPVYRERALHQPSELRAARSLSKTTTGRRCVFSVR
ncbi:unnamed protein product, partial [Prorocentrum cordatum]